jgi:hypothetical protein
MRWPESATEDLTAVASKAISIVATAYDRESWLVLEARGHDVR